MVNGKSKDVVRLSRFQGLRNVGSRIGNAPNYFWMHKKEIGLYSIGALVWSTVCLFILNTNELNSFAHEGSVSKLFPALFLSSSFVVGLMFRRWTRNLHGLN